MSDLLLAISLLSIIFFFTSLVALPFKRLRPSAKWIAPASVAAFVVSFVLFGLASDKEKKQDNQALEMGFANGADLLAAHQAGVMDGDVWRAAKAARLETARRTKVAIAKAEAARLETARRTEEAIAKAKAAEIAAIDSSKPLTKSEAMHNIRIDGFRWDKSGFGSIMIATFVIHNDNKFPVKDLVVKCTHTANSGTVVDSNTRTIFERIEARSYQSVVDMNMGFIRSAVKSSQCNVVNFTSL